MLDKVLGLSTNLQLETVVILQDPMAQKKFTTVLTNAEDIAWIQSCLKRSEVGYPGGHMGPIYECLIRLELHGQSAVEFLGTVNKGNSDYLYLYENTWRENSDGSYHREDSVPVRVPGLGVWIMLREPMGRL